MELGRDLEIIALQERELQLKSINADVAWQLGLRLRELAVSRKAPVVIDVRRFSQQLFYAALDGTSPDNGEWARKKSNVVERFHRSSYAVGLILRHKNETLFDKYGLPPASYASHGGSFPITVSSAGIIGSVTVSGLSQRADHELVVEALCGEIGIDYTILALPNAAGLPC